ncbi:zinc ribbon domain-containing protein, partial [Frankia sp. R82]|uniref:double zinc ribbon domain-containing protein n=1 Tax=Frankia sp. R82 TaxID=2950553 RepID=UPI0035ABB315|nr:hypothetical protein [Frankia sp. R82]
MTAHCAVQPACPACGAEALPADRFCEACGAALHDGSPSAPPPHSTPPRTETNPEPELGPELEPCGECGAVGLDVDGYCVTCGLQRGQAASNPCDRTELDLGPVAGVSDRGLVHRSNEDAMAAALLPADRWSDASGPAMVAVVCDGVSQAAGSGPGARAAAAAALDSLRSAAGGGGA